MPSTISRTERICLRRVVGNIDVELAFEGEQNVDAVERIDFQLLEGAVDGHRFRRNVLGLRDHTGDAVDQLVGHRIWLTVSNWNPRSFSTGMMYFDGIERGADVGRALGGAAVVEAEDRAVARAVESDSCAIARVGQCQSWPMTVHMTPSSPRRSCASAEAEPADAVGCAEQAGRRAGGGANGFLRERQFADR